MRPEGSAMLPDSGKGLLDDVVRDISLPRVEEGLPEKDRLITVKENPEGLLVRVPDSPHKLHI